MLCKATFWFLILCAGLVLVVNSSLFAQEWQPLPPEKRCPSAWGAHDERGPRIT